MDNISDTKPEARKSRFRRIVKRTVLSIAVFIAWYVLSFGAVSWYLGYDIVKASPRTATEDLARDVADQADKVFFAPLNAYAETERPGARFLRKFVGWCFVSGLEHSYVEWGDVSEDDFYRKVTIVAGGGFF